MDRIVSPAERIVDELTHRSPAILLQRNTATPELISDLLYILNASKDALVRNVLNINDSLEYSATIDLMVLPESTDKSTVLLALSDYVNGSEAKLPCVECIFPDAGRTPICYEIDENNEDVEGNSPVYLGINGGIMTGENNFLFDEQSLTLGCSTDLPEPSELAKDIRGGKHYTDALYLDNTLIFKK